MGAQNKNTRILLGIILSLSVRSVADNNQWGVLLETSLATTVCDLNRSDILEYNEMDVPFAGEGISPMSSIRQ